MDISLDGAFIYFTIPIFGGIPITQTTVSSFLVSGGMILFCLWFSGKIQKRPGALQVLVEEAVKMLYDLVESAMGKHNLHWAPFIGTIFLSCICGSLIGLTGFLRSSTADLSCTLTWAVMVSVIIWYNNIKHKGFVGWLKGFTEPIPVMTPMNIVSELAQPVAMAFRLFGNVAGGSIISSIIYAALSAVSAMALGALAESGWVLCVVLMAAGVALWFVGKKLLPKIIGTVSFALGLLGLLQTFGILSDVPILSLGVPAVLSIYFDLFSGFIQALVFSLLTMVYIAGSCPAPEETPAEAA